MNEKIESLKKEIEEKLSTVKNMNLLNEIKNTYLSKKGPIAELSNHLRELSVEEKKTFGKDLNDFKTSINEKFDYYKCLENSLYRKEEMLW